jgi:hypothetical protein
MRARRPISRGLPLARVPARRLSLASIHPARTQFQARFSSISRHLGRVGRRFETCLKYSWPRAVSSRWRARPAGAPVGAAAGPHDKGAAATGGGRRRRRAGASFTCASRPRAGPVQLRRHAAAQTPADAAQWLAISALSPGRLRRRRRTRRRRLLFDGRLKSDQIAPEEEEVTRLSSRRTGSVSEKNGKVENGRQAAGYMRGGGGARRALACASRGPLGGPPAARASVCALARRISMALYEGRARKNAKFYRKSTGSNVVCIVVDVAVSGAGVVVASAAAATNHGRRPLSRRFLSTAHAGGPAARPQSAAAGRPAPP